MLTYVFVGDEIHEYENIPDADDFPIRTWLYAAEWTMPWSYTFQVPGTTRHYWADPQHVDEVPKQLRTKMLILEK